MTTPVTTSACLFDAYGTLFDLRSAAWREAEHLGAHTDDVAALWGRKFAEYTWLRSLMDAYVPFTRVMADALDVALHTYGVQNAALADRLMHHLETLDPFADAAPALARIRRAGYATGILSNGESDLLDTTVHHAGLADHLDTIVTVEPVRVFKPRPRVYALGVAAMQRAANTICFVSANGWDAAGAAHYGYPVIWLNRTGQVADNLPGRPDAEVGALNQVADLLAG